MNNIGQTISPGLPPVKLTLTQLAIIVGSALASHPEAGDYQVAFAYNPGNGDLDCVAVSSDGENGWKIFTNCTNEYDFPVVVKKEFSPREILDGNNPDNGWTGNKIYTIRKKKIGRGWKRYKDELETRTIAVKNLTWEEVTRWVEDDISDSKAKWPELGEAKKVYFDDAIGNELPVVRWKMGVDEFRLEYDLFYNASLTKGPVA